MFGAYSCRSIDNIAGAQLSEHAFGNAVDVAGFTLADGRTLDFVHDWKKTDSQEGAFLRETHAGACQYFTTVLGPGADAFHYNHIHLDLARHGSTNTGPRRICKPAPAPDLLPSPSTPDGLPPAPNIDEPLDIAHLSAPGAVSGPGDGPDAALPPAPVGETDPDLQFCRPAPDRASTSSRRRRSARTTIEGGAKSFQAQQSKAKQKRLRLLGSILPNRDFSMRCGGKNKKDSAPYFRRRAVRMRGFGPATKQRGITAF